MLIKDTGIVETSAEDFPVLAVNVLDRLGYNVTRASKQLDQILAVQKLDEQIGEDWWRHEFRIVLRWEEASDGSQLVEIEMEETKGAATTHECQDRLDKIFLALQDDAERVKKAKQRKVKSTIHGAAQWGTEKELEASGYYLPEANPRRLIIGRDAGSRYIQVPERWTHSHAIVCGRTGVGKSRGFFIPQLIERIGTSMIITEATPGYEAGELYSLTSGWRKLGGHQIYCFNPADMTSNRINPIDRVRHAPEHLKASAAEKLAELVIMNGESTEFKGEQTWNRSEKLLLIPLLLHAAAGDPQFGHFGAIRWLLLKGPDRLAKMLYNSPSELAQMEFEGWMRLSGETDFKYGVFSGLITKLNPWMTDQMVALTETTDVDLDGMAERLFSFYLAVPSRSKDSKLIGSLMVNFLLDHILEIRHKMKYPMTMLLDEFTNFGKIAGIGDTLSIIRKNKIGLVLGFQNYFQLEQVYSRKEAQIIIDMPATQVYFKQKNYQEAKRLSEAIGRTTIEEATVSDSGRVQEFIQGRNLITPDELISLKDQVIVFTADTKPLKLPLTSPVAYQQALEYDPPIRESHEITEFIKRRGRQAKTEGAKEKMKAQEARKKGVPEASSAKQSTRKSGAKTNRGRRYRGNRSQQKDEDKRTREGEQQQPDPYTRKKRPPDMGDL